MTTSFAVTLVLAAVLLFATLASAAATMRYTRRSKPVPALLVVATLVVLAGGVWLGVRLASFVAASLT